jgi:hypothetical protein
MHIIPVSMLDGFFGILSTKSLKVVVPMFVW